MTQAALLLEVYRAPQAAPALPFGFGYADVQIYKPGQSVTPLAMENAPDSVADLLS